MTFIHSTLIRILQLQKRVLVVFRSNKNNNFTCDVYNNNMDMFFCT